MYDGKTKCLLHFFKHRKHIRKVVYEWFCVGYFISFIYNLCYASHTYKLLFYFDLSMWITFLSLKMFGKDKIRYQGKCVKHTPIPHYNSSYIISLSL